MIALARHDLGGGVIIADAAAHPWGSAPEPRDCRGERLAIGDPVIVSGGRGLPSRGVVMGFEWGRRNGRRLVLIVVRLAGDRSVRATSVEVLKQASGGGAD